VVTRWLLSYVRDVARSREPISVETVASAKPRAADWIIWDGGDGAVKGLGLKVTPTGKKIYILKYRMAGGRAAPTRRFTIGDSGGWTPKTARIKAKALLSQISDGHDPMLEKQRDRVGTLKALVADYIKAFEQDGEREAGEAGRILNRIIVPAWGSRATASISKADVRYLVKSIHRRGAPVMANRTLSVIKRLFAYAVENDLVEHHPAPTMKPLSVEQSRHRALSDAELVEVWRAADSVGWPFGQAVKLMTLSGQRREEVGGMAKAEIDRAKGLWTLPPERTKNKQLHDIHLTPQMLGILDTLPNVSKKLYFTTTGDTPISGWSKAKTQIDAKILEARQEAAKRAGADLDGVQPMPSWIFHDLRRSMTTKLNELGVSEKVADILINHRAKKKGGVAAVYNRYQYMAERKAALELWCRHFDELLSGKPAPSNVVPIPVKA
jgi:integrase